FQVVGVLEPKGQSSFGQDYDDVVIIPATTYLANMSGATYAGYLGGVFFVGGRSADTMARTERDVAALLRQRHRIQPGAEDDFMVQNLTEVANQLQQQKKTTSMLLAGVALISLLVGGIGIMNIMLVSVTERTREIGLRMAIGATPEQILL